MGNQLTYEYADIERYLQQQMSPREMHDFEKAMLEDPFLADAMEGFSTSNSSVSATHLQLIANEISGNQAKAKVVSIAGKKTSWWRVAAIILVLAGAGIITFRITQPTLDNTESKQLAQSSKAASSIIADSIGPVKPSIATLETGSLPGRDLVAQNANSSPIISSVPAPVIAYKKNSQTDTAVIVMNQASIATTLKAELADKSADEKITTIPQARSAAPALPIHEFKGKVVDPLGEPLPFASVRAEGTNIGTITDAKGNFKIKVSDSIVTIKVQSMGYEMANVKLRSNQPYFSITMKEDQMSLSEVVVTGISSNRKNIVKKQTDGLASPSGGWNNFNEYMTLALDSFKTSSNYTSSIDVELEFDIDKKGKPTGIQVLNTVPKVVSEKTSSLLKAGPRWRSANRKEKIKLRITL